MRSPAAVILLAAGTGSRFQQTLPKARVLLAGEPIFVHSARLFGTFSEIEQRILVVPPGEEFQAFEDALTTLEEKWVLVEGGARRRDSVMAALEQMQETEVVLVHDAARALVDATVVERVLRNARTHGSVVPVVRVADALLRADGERSLGAVDRSKMRVVQTPQGFRNEVLREAHERAPAEWDAPDDGAMVEAAGFDVVLTEGAVSNFKLTWPEDLDRAEAELARRKTAPGDRKMETRVGIGWDVHPLVEGRPFVLAGIDIPYTHGPAGHSDGDALSHAIADALIGAAGLGDIGAWFPDTDPACSGISGPEILRETTRRLAEAGWAPAQVDSVLIADQPRLAPWRDRIIDSLAAALGLSPECVGVKGKRTEGLGGLSGGSGIGCHAVAVIRRIPREAS